MDEMQDTPSDAPESILSDSPEKTTPNTQSEFNFKDHIPESLKNEKVWESVPDFPTMAKNYVDATKYNVGALKLPGKDASPEEWGKVWGKLGRPESVEGYPKIYLEEDESIDTASLDAMKGVAHSAGVTRDQWDNLQNGWLRLQREKIQASREAARVTTEELKNEWGGAFEKKLALAQRTIRTLGGEELMDEIVQSGMGNSQRLLRFLERVSKNLASEGIIDNQFEGQMTKEAATSKINELTISEAYLKGSHPNHQEVVAEVQKLFQLVYD